MGSPFCFVSFGGADTTAHYSIDAHSDRVEVYLKKTSEHPLPHIDYFLIWTGLSQEERMLCYGLGRVRRERSHGLPWGRGRLSRPRCRAWRLGGGRFIKPASRCAPRRPELTGATPAPTASDRFPSKEAIATQSLGPS